MDTSGDRAPQVQGPGAFWSRVSGILGGLDWGSMPPGTRSEWLAVLSNVEGAVAATRARAIAHDAGSKGAAERTAELVRATGMSGRDAAAAVKVADALTAAPAVVGALASGAITTGHVEAMSRDLPADHRRTAMADPAVLASAMASGVDGFRAEVRGWKAHVDRDVEGRRLAASQQARRSAGWHTAPDGMVHLRAELAPDAGAVVVGALRSTSERLWRREDDREVDPSDPARGRSVAQRNADAVLKMAELVNGADGPSGPPRVDLVVIADNDALATRVQGSHGLEVSGGVSTGGSNASRGLEACGDGSAGVLDGSRGLEVSGGVSAGVSDGSRGLEASGDGSAGVLDGSRGSEVSGGVSTGGSNGSRGLEACDDGSGGLEASGDGSVGALNGSHRCETSDGIPLTAAAVRRLACEAGVIPAVMGGFSQVLDLGRRTRTVTPAQRAALVVRDGGCIFPGCDRPESWCDAHHVIHWLELGPSGLWNLVLLCSAHHRAVHEGGWALAHADRRTPATGRLVFTDPTGQEMAPERRSARHRGRSNQPAGR